MAEDSKAHWEEQVSVLVLEETTKWARISGLPAELKKKAWQEINLAKPALAALLREQELQDIMRMFDAELYVESSLVPSLPSEALKRRLRG